MQNIPAEGRDESGFSKPGGAGGCMLFGEVVPSARVQKPATETCTALKTIIQRDHSTGTRLPGLCNVTGSFDVRPDPDCIESKLQLHLASGHVQRLKFRFVANKETEKITAASARNGALLGVKLLMHGAGQPRNN